MWTAVIGFNAGYERYTPAAFIEIPGPNITGSNFAPLTTWQPFPPDTNQSIAQNTFNADTTTWRFYV